MSETLSSDNSQVEITDATIYERLNNLIPLFETFGDLAERPTGNDPRIRAYALAGRHLLLNDDRFRISMRSMLDFREDRERPTPPLYAANLSLRVAQHMLKRRKDYSVISSTPEGWVNGVSSILNSPAKRNDFDTLLSLEEVRTNVPDREMGPQLVLSLYGSRFGSNPINLLDVGPSIGAGTKGLITGRIKHPIKVNQIVPGTVPGSAELFNNQSVTDYINQKIDNTINFGDCVGVDLMGFDYLSEPKPSRKKRLEGNADWVESCFYPTELVEDRGGVLSTFRDLVKLKVPNYKQHQLDFTDPGNVTRLQNLQPEGTFDVITILTMMNQLTEEERVRVLENAKSLISPEGLIIVQDFAKVSSKTPSGMEFYPTWHPYTYRTMVIDMMASKQLEELLWWSSGRCKEVIIAPTAQFFTKNLPLSD